MLDGIPLETYTPAALLGITVILLLVGRIVPKSTLTEKIKEAERWRKAYETERDARLASDKQNAELLEFAKATHSILDALFVNTESSRQGGTHRVVPTSR
jgi:hypothetical protein